ncbi:ABC transporter substrate-binding protein [Lysinibacillus telephonicus]|uniref:Extracellular solute-binding protein n=1 Tax=Lysinibacillus telephonicus TaxID=1714840 RepID=A0A431UWV4_9BACI|nr:ABC transporter substrate-binding protein [Lysinibacillus telephonicus]RTQ95763.1 extracellular solute-binding protein [Lysinibacillus telephonicus]
MKNSVYKKSWLFLLAALLLFVLAACTNDTTSEDTETEQPETTDEGTEEAGSGEISGQLEIQYFVGGYGDEWWKTVIEDFKKAYPDVEVIEHAGPDINTEMNTRWISNDPPDVVYIDGNGSSETQMISEGQLMDISEWAKGITMENGTPLLDSFISPAEELDGGKIYSLPLVFDTWGVWYDGNWFEEQGWEAPTDFDSWIESMKTIKEEAGIAPFITTGQYAQYFQRGVLYPAFAAAGGEELLNNLSNGVVEAWESEEALEVMKKVEKIVDEGLVDEGFAAYSHTQSQMNFLLHKNAYIPVGFWLPNEMINDTPEGFEYSFVPTPMNDSGNPMALIPDIRPVAIAQEADNPEAAKAFLEFIFTEKYAQAFAESTGAIMNLKNIDLSANNNVPSFLKGINEMINNPGAIQIYERNTPVDAKEQEINVEITNEIKLQIVEILMGRIDAEEFVQRMTNKAKELRGS